MQMRGKPYTPNPKPPSFGGSVVGQEYYALIMEMSGKLAAAGISGKMGTREQLVTAQVRTSCLGLTQV